VVQAALSRLKNSSTRQIRALQQSKTHFDYWRTLREGKLARLWDENWIVHLKKKPDGSFVDPHAATHAIEWEQRNFYVILFHGPKPHPQQLHPQTLNIFPSDYPPRAEEHPRNGRPGGAGTTSWTGTWWTGQRMVFSSETAIQSRFGSNRSSKATLLHTRLLITTNLSSLTR
jgi:hypothetical protein